MYTIKTNLTIIGDVTYSGDLKGKIPNPNISSDIGNTIQQKTDGLFVPDMNPTISTDEGNILTSTETGLYVPTTPEPTPYTGSSSVDVSNNIISSKISSTSGNQLSISGNGLFVPQPPAQITYSGSNAIDVTGTVISSKVSSTAGNQLSINSTGLYVPQPPAQITYSGSTSVDVTGTVISTKISSTAGNQLSINGNGLYVPSGSIANQYLWTRDKTEVLYSGVNFAITSTPTSLLSLLKVLTPTSGTLSKFFNTTSNKLNVYNLNSSLFFQIIPNGYMANRNTNFRYAIEFHWN